MAVETPPHTNFSPQLLFNLNSEIATIMNNHHFYNTQMDPSTMPHESSSVNFPHTLLHQQIPTNNITDSNALPFPHQIQLSPQSTFIDTNLLNLNYLHQQQFSQINNLIAQHTENLRTAFEQQRIQQSRMLLSTVKNALSEKMKIKEEKIQRIGTLNLLLEENAMKLMNDTQMWKQNALMNQDTVIRLDREIKRLRATQGREEHRNDGGGDDVESVCCSNEVVKEVRKKCVKCGVNEPQMVLMPCKHFCVCTMCGSGLLNCPLCFTGIDVSINVNSFP